MLATNLQKFGILFYLIEMVREQKKREELYIFKIFFILLYKNYL